LLLQKGANVNINKGLALTNAIQQNSRAVIEAIMQSPQLLPHGKHLFYAIENEDISLVKKLCMYPTVDPSIDGNACIKTAVASGLCECVEILLRDSRVDPTKAVAKARSLDVLDVLLRDPRVDPSIKNSQVLVAAVENGNVGVVRRLSEDGRVDFGLGGGKILMAALKRANWEMVEIILGVKVIKLIVRKTALILVWVGLSVFERAVYVASLIWWIGCYNFQSLMSLFARLLISR
jgi:hypothetical protein